jgi:serine/threonine protein kinase
MHASDSSTTKPRGRIGTPDLRPGALLAGRYRLGECVGTGGFAAVFRADDERLHRQVAVKVLDVLGWAREDQIDECLARFRSEARAAARIEHPSVVTIHDMGVLEPEGVPYIVMELLRGHDLEQELEQFGALPPDRAIRCVRQGLQALVAAHGMGIVHRDLKPSNLFLVNPRRPTESLRVLDFGIARFLDASANLTKTGQMMGTARFMAPEYINDGVVTPQSDVYQMGLILAELLTGRRVIEAEQFALAVARACAGKLDLPANLMDSAVGPILRRAVALDPQNRFRSAGHFLSMLDRIDPDSLQDLASDAPSLPRRPVTCIDAPPELGSEPRASIGEDLAPHEAKHGGVMVIATRNPASGLDATAAAPAAYPPLDSIEFALPVSLSAPPEPHEGAAGASSAAERPGLSWADDPVTPMWKAFSAHGPGPSPGARPTPSSPRAAIAPAPDSEQDTPPPGATAADPSAQDLIGPGPRALRSGSSGDQGAAAESANAGLVVPLAPLAAPPATQGVRAPQTAEMRVQAPLARVPMPSSRRVPHRVLSGIAVAALGLSTLATLGLAIWSGALDSPFETAAPVGASETVEVATGTGDDAVAVPPTPAPKVVTDLAMSDSVRVEPGAVPKSDGPAAAPVVVADKAAPRPDSKPRRSRKRSAKAPRATKSMVAAPVKTAKPDFVRRRLPD